jgi:23S rRNA pseudouridine2604 synthase
MHANPPESISLNKYISSTGFCSRREADKLIAAERVMLNGVAGVLGNRVLPGDEVTVDGKPIISNQNDVYIAFNKPVGVTCTTETNIRGNIITYINHPKRIFPIGRLDKPSQGLIFLTNDGDIVNKILRAGNNHEKEYIVTVNKPITPAFIKTMQNGVPILDTVTQKCEVEKLSTFVFRIVLTQGLNRQIRRMCDYLDYEVRKLERVRIMNITLQGIAPGKWRNLTKEELAYINQQTAGSIKTEEASRLNDDEE